MSHRKEQVESTLKRAISEVLMRSMSDPRIEGLVSVQRVRVTDDFKVADIFVSVLPEKFEKRSLAGLRAAAGHIHTKVFKAVAMRAVPRFVFQIDDALKKEEAIFDSIAQAMDREGLDPSQVEHVLKPKTDAELQAEYEASLQAGLDDDEETDLELDDEPDDEMSDGSDDEDQPEHEK